jgi:hypothetical protein
MFLCYTIIQRFYAYPFAERTGVGNASPASLKRVTHSDTFRQAGKVSRGRCRGLAPPLAAGRLRKSILPFGKPLFFAAGKAADKLEFEESGVRNDLPKM